MRRMPQLSQGALFVFTVLCAGPKLYRCRPSSHPLLPSNSPCEWRGAPMMALRHSIYKAYNMTGSAWLPSFLCSGVRLLLGTLDGGWLCFYMASLVISLFTVNGRSECLHALVCICGIVPFTRPFIALSILTAEMLMSCMLFVRVGVLPPTPSTLYRESCQSLYETYTVLVVFRSMARFKMRPFLTLRSSVTEISKDRDWFHLRVAFVRRLQEHEKGTQSR